MLTLKPTSLNLAFVVGRTKLALGPTCDRRRAVAIPPLSLEFGTVPEGSTVIFGDT